MNGQRSASASTSRLLRPSCRLSCSSGHLHTHSQFALPPSQVRPPTLPCTPNPVRIRHRPPLSRIPCPAVCQSQAPPKTSHFLHTCQVPAVLLNNTPPRHIEPPQPVFHTTTPPRQLVSAPASLAGITSRLEAAAAAAANTTSGQRLWRQQPSWQSSILHHPQAAIDPTPRACSPAACRGPLPLQPGHQQQRMGSNEVTQSRQAAALEEAHFPSVGGDSDHHAITAIHSYCMWLRAALPGNQGLCWV